MTFVDRLADAESQDHVIFMDEFFRNNAYQILELFIEHPHKDFSLRGIARELKLNHGTVIKYAAGLVKLDLIRQKDETLYPVYYANTESSKYTRYKIEHIVSKIIDSGVIEIIQAKTLPSSIILFGSCAKGVFTEQSDMDLFVEAKTTRIELTKFEKILGRKINLLFEQKISNLSAELRDNILNGRILYGFVKAKK